MAVAIASNCNDLRHLLVETLHGGGELLEIIGQRCLVRDGRETLLEIIQLPLEILLPVALALAPLGDRRKERLNPPTDLLADLVDLFPHVPQLTREILYSLLVVSGTTAVFVRR